MSEAALPTGATLHYIDSGAGTQPVPAVVIHGMLNTAEDMGRVTDWLIAEGYRVIAPTLRGYGESTPKPRTFPYDFYQRDADDVLALLDDLEIDRAHLLGYSDGGEVALLMAGEQPERFQTVTTWGAVGYYGEAMRPVAQRMFPPTWISEAERTRHGINDADGFVLGWIDAVRRIIDGGGALGSASAHRITAPLLMMLGEQDTLNPAEYAQRTIDAAPNARLLTFQCGHAVHEHAWLPFKQAVGAHLQR